MRRAKEIHWISGYYRSHEHCVLSKSDYEIIIRSEIAGSLNAIPYQAEYLIRTTQDWSIRSFELTYALNGIKHSVSASRSNRDWIVNGQVRPDVKNCTDIDISITPFTNSLPINRLRLDLNKPQPIEVLYIDVPENSIRVSRQRYTRKSGTVYNFQTIPNEFEADIIVDNDGFVVHYPQLFERIEL